MGRRVDGYQYQPGGRKKMAKLDIVQLIDQNEYEALRKKSLFACSITMTIAMS